MNSPASTHTNTNLVAYSFEYKGKSLQLTGRSDVASDEAIIYNVFLKDMFSMEHMPQHASLHNFYHAIQLQGKRPVIVDAGANIGASSVYFHEQYPAIKSISIEPSGNNFMLLESNVRGYDAHPIQAALSCSNGQLWMNDEDFGPIAVRVGLTGKTKVNAYCMERILQDFSPADQPFIAKIDIEGGEALLFSENTAWLDLFPLVIIELHDWMLPFTNVSNNFYKAVGHLEFDLINFGENTFCFNKRLLKAHPAAM